MNKASLTEAETFLALAESGGFGVAARELGITQSTVSRRIAIMEARLGHKLVERTTRRVTLSEVGEAFAAELRDIILRLGEAEARLLKAESSPRGLMRISMPTGYGRSRVIPRLAVLGARHPDLRFDLDLSDRYVDIIGEGYEMAIRLAEPRESGLDCRRIDRFQLHLCAAPAYLAARTLPSEPAELLAHDCIVQRTYAPRATWRMVWHGKPVELTIMPRWTVTDMAAARLLALSGAGIALLPSYLVEQDLLAGGLTALLPETRLAEVNVYAVFPSSRIALGRIGPVLESLTRN